MTHVKVRPLFAFLALFAASVFAACNNTVYGPPGPPPTAAPSCVAPACLKLSGSLQTVALPDVGKIAVTARVAGTGTISLHDSLEPAAAPALLGIFARRADLRGAIFYLKITAINGSAKLSYTPGLTVVFPGQAPSGTLRLAALENGVWTTVGKKGKVRGSTVTFAATRVAPPIHLKDGDSYELGVYGGGVLPPTPSPSPSPTLKPTPTPTTTPTPTPKPGALSVTVACNQSADACSNGTMTTAGSIEFTATGDTATLTPSESPASTYTLKSDTCNPTDDPSAGGNWAKFAPGAGNSATAFTVTAKNAGTNGNPATCSAVLADSSGQTVTIDVQVTLGNVGINEKRGHLRP